MVENINESSLWSNSEKFGVAKHMWNYYIFLFINVLTQNKLKKGFRKYRNISTNAILSQIHSPSGNSSKIHLPQVFLPRIWISLYEHNKNPDEEFISRIKPRMNWSLMNRHNWKVLNIFTTQRMDEWINNWKILLKLFFPKVLRFVWSVFSFEQNLFRILPGNCLIYIWTRILEFFLYF